MNIFKVYKLNQAEIIPGNPLCRRLTIECEFLKCSTSKFSLVLNLIFSPVSTPPSTTWSIMRRTEDQLRWPCHTSKLRERALKILYGGGLVLGIGLASNNFAQSWEMSCELLRWELPAMKQWVFRNPRIFCRVLQAIEAIEFSRQNHFFFPIRERKRRESNLFAIQNSTNNSKIQGWKWFQWLVIWRFHWFFF